MESAAYAAARIARQSKMDANRRRRSLLSIPPVFVDFMWNSLGAASSCGDRSVVNNRSADGNVADRALLGAVHA